MKDYLHSFIVDSKPLASETFFVMSRRCSTGYGVCRRWRLVTYFYTDSMQIIKPGRKATSHKRKKIVSSRKHDDFVNRNISVCKQNISVCKRNISACKNVISLCKDAISVCKGVINVCKSVISNRRCVVKDKLFTEAIKYRAASLKYSAVNVKY